VAVDHTSCRNQSTYLMTTAVAEFPKSLIEKGCIRKWKINGESSKTFHGINWKPHYAYHEFWYQAKIENDWHLSMHLILQYNVVILHRTSAPSTIADLSSQRNSPACCHSSNTTQGQCHLWVHLKVMQHMIPNIMFTISFHQTWQNHANVDCTFSLCCFDCSV
jgi:hypothetical protein